MRLDIYGQFVVSVVTPNGGSSKGRPIAVIEDREACHPVDLLIPNDLTTDQLQWYVARSRRRPSFRSRYPSFLQQSFSSLADWFDHYFATHRKGRLQWHADEPCASASQAKPPQGPTGRAWLIVSSS
jgi:hypothetical protein